MEVSVCAAAVKVRRQPRRHEVHEEGGEIFVPKLVLFDVFFPAFLRVLRGFVAVI